MDLSGSETEQWCTSYIERTARHLATLRSSSLDSCRREADEFLSTALSQQNAGVTNWFFGVESTAGRVGSGWLRTTDTAGSPTAELRDLELVGDSPPSPWFAAALRGCVVSSALDKGATSLGLVVAGDESPAAAVAAAGPRRVVATRMIHTLTASTAGELSRDGVSLDVMTAAQFDPFVAELITTYAKSIATTGDMTAEAALERSRAQVSSLLANGVATPHHHLLTVIYENHSVGVVWLFESDLYGDHRGFVYDIKLSEQFRGRGLGRAAMIAAEDFLRQRGCGYVELNVFGFNDVARSLYNSLGYVVREEFVDLEM